MATVETAGEFEIASRGRTGVLEKAREQLFKERDIFESDEGVVLTPLGQQIQKISIIKGALLDSQLSQERRKEIIFEIEEISKEKGLNNHDFSEVDSQFRGLIKQRVDRIAFECPISQKTQSSGLKKYRKLPIVGFLTRILGVSKI